MTDMPPPPRKEPLASNAEFRKLLETPRPNRGGDGSLDRKAKTNSDAPRQKKKSSKPKPVKEEAEDDGPGYRDRAEERRKGVNPDYDRVAMDMQTIGGKVGAAGDLHGISVEESKFLGGDVDHTHLVKGLDYALLQKVRGEIVTEGTENGSPKKSAHTREVVKFKSAAGRAIFNAVFAKARVQPSEFFLPGRTAFVFNMDVGGPAEMPTTLRRSKADCPPVLETMTGGMDPQVMERMVKIMSYMRGSSGKGGKLKRKEKLRMLQMMDSMAANGDTKHVRQEPQEPAHPSGPADADEDIFGDAGREIPTEDADGKADPAKPELAGPLPPPPSVGPSRPSGGYNAAAAAYAAYGDDDSAPPPPPPPAPLQDEEDMELDRLAGLAPMPATELDPPKTVRPAKAQEEEVIAKDTDDAYEECYPDYGGFSGAVIDSDEEDLSHMDNKEGRSRYDFGTEQEWEKYKSNKEMMPKAAFQFGVKMSDGRKAHNKLGKHVEQKEQSQLRKIQTMFKDNHGEKYKKAFEDDEAKASANPKRRRI